MALGVTIRVILSVMLSVSFTLHAEPSAWVLGCFSGLTNADVSIRQKSAYGLIGYYTDNGAVPSREYMDLLQSNSEYLLKSLSDEDLQVRYYVTELLAGRFISQYPEPAITFVSLLDREEARKFEADFLKNLDTKRELLVKSSINALVNLKKCEYLSEMLSRTGSLSKYERSSALAAIGKLERYCDK